jgi:hypothetical protein
VGVNIISPLWVCGRDVGCGKKGDVVGVNIIFPLWVCGRDVGCGKKGDGWV